MEEGFFSKDILEKINEKDVCMLNPLTLAYIGDCVFDIYVRTNVLINNKNSTINKIHKKTVEIVRANKQKDILMKIMDKLTNEEISIYKRGRNSKSNTSRKNVQIVNYRIATGFEALLGYLYLTKNHERLKEIIEYSLEGEL